MNEKSNYPFESFNARSLTPKQVASGFVPPEAFIRLCKRRHSIVAGPRGSGKTTLLKMLQVSALRAWDHPDAEAVRQQIDFTGVFVPTDRTWNDQLCALGGESLPARAKDALGVSAFTTQILRALVSACIERTSTEPHSVAPGFRRVSLTAAQEVRLSRDVASTWGLSETGASFLGIRSSLSRRLMAIHALAGRIALLGPDRWAEVLDDCEYLHLNFLSAVPAFLDIFEEVSGLRDERWALLFDELELAPDTIRSSLCAALRSVDQRLLLKLSIAPFSRELDDSVKAASDRNDFDSIQLWYPSKEAGYPFSDSLVQQILLRRGIHADPQAVFGRTVAEQVRSKRRGEYSQAALFKSLAAKDPSFRGYLVRSGISIDNISQPSEPERAAKLRKIVQLVAIRDAYLRGGDSKEGGDPALRSRKSVQMYCGVPSLFAVAEGNPRWLIGLIDRLLESRGPTGEVTFRDQDREISALISRFTAFLRTVPSWNGAGSANPRTVFAIVNGVGKALSHEVLGGAFNPDPAGTFIVDSNADEALLASLEQAIYVGAVVYVPESESQIATGSLRGKRFRLSYLLAPKYRLPLVLLRAKSLSLLLQGAPSSGEAAQEGLF